MSQDYLGLDTVSVAPGGEAMPRDASGALLSAVLESYVPGDPISISWELNGTQDDPDDAYFRWITLPYLQAGSIAVPTDSAIIIREGDGTFTPQGSQTAIGTAPAEDIQVLNQKWCLGCRGLDQGQLDALGVDEANPLTLRIFVINTGSQPVDFGLSDGGLLTLADLTPDCMESQAPLVCAIISGPP